MDLKRVPMVRKNIGSYPFIGKAAEGDTQPKEVPNMVILV